MKCQTDLCNWAMNQHLIHRKQNSLCDSNTCTKRGCENVFHSIDDHLFWKAGNKIQSEEEYLNIWKCSYQCLLAVLNHFICLVVDTVKCLAGFPASRRQVEKYFIVNEWIPESICKSFSPVISLRQCYYECHSNLFLAHFLWQNIRNV